MVMIAAAGALAAAALPGCGWKTVERAVRVRGQVLEAETGRPVEGAIIDIADDRDRLDFRIGTGILTDGEGRFDTVFRYGYDKWMWLGIPVTWFPDRPEKLYLEVQKTGYRPRVAEIEFGAPGDRSAPPESLSVPPIRIRQEIRRGRNRRRGSDRDE